MNQLKIAAANVAGFNDRLQRQQAITELARQANVLLLSETRCPSQAAADAWSAELSRQGWRCFFSLSNTANTGGTAVLIHSTSALSNLTVHPINIAEGRVTMVTGYHNDEPICLLAVYAPATRSDRPGFFAQLAALSPPRGHMIVAGGDMNCTLSDDDFTGADRHMGAGRPGFKSWVHRWDLQDAWPFAQQRDGAAMGHTKFTGSGHGSRIDYIFVSTAHSPRLHKAFTLAITTSDHRAVIIKIGDSERVRSSRWRLNAALLQHPQLCSLIAYSFRLHMQEVASGGCTLGEAWVRFKATAAQHCRDMGKALKARRKAALRDAQDTIRRATSAEEREAAESVLQQREAFERQGELARRGVAAMAGDRPSREFFKRMAAPSSKCDISAITLAATREEVRDQPSIMAEMARFWKGIYGSDMPREPEVINNAHSAVHQSTQAISPEREAAMNQALQRLRHALSAEQREELAQNYTSEELEEALKSLPPGSSPGNDGLSVAFYIEFWPMVGGVLTSLLNASMRGEPLPPSLLAARVVLSQKTTHAAPEASHFRPISLLGTDYKIMSKAVTRRMLQAVPSLCHETQTGFIPGRSILHNVTCNRDLIEYHRGDASSTAVIAFLDFEKAFDRVSFHFRDRVLLKMGFPLQVLRTLTTFYHNAPIQLEVNGALSAPFYATRGTRQGCPLSPVLFSLYAEPLGALMRELASEGSTPTGISLPATRRLGAATRLGGCQYADDTTLYCNSPASLERAITAINTEFCLASGAQLNVAKSRALLLGEPPPPRPAVIAGIPVLGETETVGSLGALYSGASEQPRRLPGMVQSMANNIPWWRQQCNSVHSRARLANAMLSSKLWYHMQFEHAEDSELQVASNKVWSCLWGTGDDGKPQRGHVTKDRACAPVTLGGLGVIEPRVMHAALKSRMVNMVLDARGEWWTAFSEALIERAAGTGCGTGFDALVSVEDRAAVASRCSSKFWQQALAAWAGLQLTQPAPPLDRQPQHTVGATMLVQRALRSTLPQQVKQGLQALAQSGRQYLSDFYDFQRRRMARPPPVLTSDPSVQRRNAALHELAKRVTREEAAAMAACPAPAPGALCRVRGTRVFVIVLGPAAAENTVQCTCTAPCPLLTQQVQRTSAIGPSLRQSEHLPESSPRCACTLSPLLVHPGSREFLGEAENTALLTYLLENKESKLSITSKVSVMRHYFRALRQDSSKKEGTTRPPCEDMWRNLGEVQATQLDWEMVWKSIGSANLTSYARTLLWRIAHHRVALNCQEFIRTLRRTEDDSCLLCGRESETMAHLFADCSATAPLWDLISPLAARLGITDSALPTTRLAGLPSELNTTTLRSLLPADCPAVAAGKLRKVALQTWCELRALVLAAIWQARTKVLLKKVDSVTGAARMAASAVRTGLRYLAYLHLPYLSPWSLEPGLEAKQELQLPQLLWKQLAAHALQRREAGADSPAHAERA